jgi:hypothetical protein
MPTLHQYIERKLMKAFSQGSESVISFIGKIAEILQFSNLFPAAIFVLVNFWFFLPEYPEFPFFVKIIDMDGNWEPLFLIFSVSLLSYIFSPK